MQFLASYSIGRVPGDDDDLTIFLEPFTFWVWPYAFAAAALLRICCFESIDLGFFFLLTCRRSSPSFS